MCLSHLLHYIALLHEDEVEWLSMPFCRKHKYCFDINLLKISFVALKNPRKYTNAFSILLKMND